MKSNKVCIGVFSALGGYNQTYCEGGSVQHKHTNDIATIVELNFKTKMLMVVYGADDLNHPHEIKFEDVTPYEIYKIRYLPEFFNRDSTIEVYY